MAAYLSGVLAHLGDLTAILNPTVNAYKRAAGYTFAVIPASDMLDLSKAASALDVSHHELRLASEADMAADFPDHRKGFR